MKNYKQSKKNLETWESREILPNQNFAEYLAKQNERNQEFAKEHHLLPRKSVCAATTLGDGSSENSDSDKQSVSSGSSGSSRSSTYSHERQGSSSQISVQSWEDNSPRKASDGYLGNGLCRRGSLPSIGEGRRRSSMDFNQNQEYKRSDEDIRLPGKMIPNLPVTTQTTRQLTDLNAANGTLKRRPSNSTIKAISPSHATMKRNIPSYEARIISPSSGEKKQTLSPSGESRLMSPTYVGSRMMSPPSCEGKTTCPSNVNTRMMSPPSFEGKTTCPSNVNTKVMSPPVLDDDDDDDDDDLPLPPPPLELLHPTSPSVQEEGYYSVVNVTQPAPCAIYDIPKPRIGGSLPNSPQKRPAVYAKPPIVGILPPPPQCPLPSPPSSSYSAPQSPAPRTSGPYVTSPVWSQAAPMSHHTTPISPPTAPMSHHTTPISPPTAPMSHHTTPISPPTFPMSHNTQFSPPTVPMSHHASPLKSCGPQMPVGSPIRTPVYQVPTQHMTSPERSPMPRGPMIHPGSPAHAIYSPAHGAITPPHAASPLHTGHRRASSSPYQGETLKRAPPPPKRSQTTRLSNTTDSPKTQYFISDLQRVLTQKQAWSLEMPPEPSFPPVPPPHKPRNSVASPLDEEWLPPPPAELLIELQEARRKSCGPKPPPKHYMSPQHSQMYESHA